MSADRRSRNRRAGVALPVGSRLLHIGPQKTGTSTLQQAFHETRCQLRKLGVHYAGSSRQHRVAAAAAVKDQPLHGNLESSLASWPRLVEDVRSSTAERVVVSAEMFANAPEERIPEVVEKLDPGLHVAVTLRPLVNILPSQWQQYVQNGLATPYLCWLREMFQRRDTTTVTPTFWHRHQHDELVARWARVVGPERVTVVVADETERDALLRAFESLLALPTGTLVAGGRDNRSLTASEAEVVRTINVLYKENGWPKDIYEKVLRQAFHNGIKTRTPARGEPRLATPQWAREQATEVAGEIVTGLRELARSGVRVIGDLDRLQAPPPRADGQEVCEPPTAVGTDVAAKVAIELVRASVIEPKRSVLRLLQQRAPAASVADPGQRRSMHLLRRRLRRLLG